MRLQVVVVAVVMAAALAGCTMGFRVDHASSDTGIGAQVQGPGQAVVLRDPSGEALAGASFTFNPSAIARNLVDLVTKQVSRLGGGDAGAAQ